MGARDEAVLSRLSAEPPALIGGDAAPAVVRGRLPTIDALRGVASLAVLVAHLPFSTSTMRGSPDERPESALPAAVNAVFEHGTYGVHLFLIISGFCIHMAWARDPSDAAAGSFRLFWKRRLHRLYPPYFVTLLLSIAGLYVVHSVFGGASGSLALQLGYSDGSQLALDLVLLLLLAQNLNGASQRIGNGPFWTLALEEQLYALYFPLLWMRKHWSWTRALVVVALTTLSWRLFATYVVTDLPLGLLGPSRWFEWTLGALAVEAHLGRVVLPAWCRSAKVGVVLVCLALAVVHSEALGVPSRPLVPISDAVVSIALFTLVNAACEARWAGAGSGLVARFFGWVGTFSYSLYLTHSLVIVAAKQLTVRAGVGTIGTLLARFALAIAGGWLFYVLVERRFLNASRRGVSSTVDGGDAASVRASGL